MLQLPEDCSFLQLEKRNWFLQLQFSSLQEIIQLVLETTFLKKFGFNRLTIKTKQILKQIWLQDTVLNMLDHLFCNAQNYCIHQYKVKCSSKHLFYVTQYKPIKKNTKNNKQKNKEATNKMKPTRSNSHKASRAPDVWQGLWLARNWSIALASTSACWF